MLTIQDIGNEVVYKTALAEIKKKMPFYKRPFKKSFTRKEAQEIQKLRISKTKLENLDFLRFFPRLEELIIDEVIGIRNISGVQNCLNLKLFYATNSEIEDLSDIVSCRNLTEFDYYFYGEYQKKSTQSDFSFLQKLSELDAIDIAGNELEDTSIFAKLSKLTDLALDGNPIKTIVPLKVMSNLEFLAVENCGLSCLEDLEDFKALNLVFAENNLFTEEQKKKYQEKFPDIKFFF